MSRLTSFLSSCANSQGSTEEHLSPLYFQLVARRTSKGRFCLITYNHHRKQSNNRSFQNEFRYRRDTGENGLFRIIWNTRRTQIMVVLLTVSGHFVSVNMNSKNAISVDSKNLPFEIFA